MILGAAGRDFHNFNVRYHNDPSVTVVAFTAAQIPGIAGRRYPPSLAGPLYPQGIPIEPEEQLEAICARQDVTQVAFAEATGRCALITTIGGLEEAERGTTGTAVCP